MIHKNLLQMEQKTLKLHWQAGSENTLPTSIHLLSYTKVRTQHR